MNFLGILELGKDLVVEKSTVVENAFSMRSEGFNGLEYTFQVLNSPSTTEYEGYENELELWIHTIKQAVQRNDNICIPSTSKILREEYDPTFDEYFRNTNLSPITGEGPEDFISIDDLEEIKSIHRGSSSRTLRVVSQESKKSYAMKIFKRTYGFVDGKYTYEPLESSPYFKMTFNHPFLVHLYQIFETGSKIYLLQDFLSCGELFFVNIKKLLEHFQKDMALQSHNEFKTTITTSVFTIPSELGKPILSLELVRFYISQLVSVVGYIHSKNIIYVHLRPENLSLDRQGYLVLTGLYSKLHNREVFKSGNSAGSCFLGTREYYAPEYLVGEGYNRSIDWWGVGVILYELITGLPPFYSENINEVYELILEKDLVFPDFMKNNPREYQSVMDLISDLLIREPEKRLSDCERIKQHPFFENLDWESLENRSLKPPDTIPFLIKLWKQGDVEMMGKRDEKERLHFLVNEVGKYYCHLDGNKDNTVCGQEGVIGLKIGKNGKKVNILRCFFI